MGICYRQQQVWDPKWNLCLCEILESYQDMDCNSVQVDNILLKENLVPLAWPRMLCVLWNRDRSAKLTVGRILLIIVTAIITDVQCPLSSYLATDRPIHIVVQGNQSAQNADYPTAIRLFTEAIKLEPSDYRFYGNRSYCYDRIMRFDKWVCAVTGDLSIQFSWRPLVLVFDSSPWAQAESRLITHYWTRRVVKAIGQFLHTPGPWHWCWHPFNWDYRWNTLGISVFEAIAHNTPLKPTT